MLLVRAASCLVLAAGVLGAPDALAYCRTTTCDPHKDTCATNGDGCVKDGVPVTWTKLPLVYRFSAHGSVKLDDDKVRAAVRAGVNRWSNVECPNGRTSLRFQEHSDFMHDGTPFGIVFRDDAWDHTDSLETLAITNVSYGTVFGDIASADIEVNTAQHDFTFGDAPGGTDFEAVVTHEIGHYIGLAHSTDPASIMVPAYCQAGAAGRCTDKKQGRELAQDDVDAVCALYPPTGIAGVEYGEPTPAGCDASGARGGSGAAALAGVVALGITRARRRTGCRSSASSARRCRGA